MQINFWRDTWIVDVGLLISYVNPRLVSQCATIPVAQMVDTVGECNAWSTTRVGNGYGGLEGFERVAFFHQVGLPIA
ncbi:hypothetical protein V6N13_107705 [Hibiscus sabdariffa]